MGHLYLLDHTLTLITFLQSVLPRLPTKRHIHPLLLQISSQDNAHLRPQLHSENTSSGILTLAWSNMLYRTCDPIFELWWFIIVDKSRARGRYKRGGRCGERFIDVEWGRDFYKNFHTQYDVKSLGPKTTIHFGNVHSRVFIFVHANKIGWNFIKTKDGYIIRKHFSRGRTLLQNHEESLKNVPPKNFPFVSALFRVGVHNRIFLTGDSKNNMFVLFLFIMKRQNEI